MLASAVPPIPSLGFVAGDCCPQTCVPVNLDEKNASVDTQEAYYLPQACAPYNFACRDPNATSLPLVCNYTSAATTDTFLGRPCPASTRLGNGFCDDVREQVTSSGARGEGTL